MSRLNFKLEKEATGSKARAGSFTTLHGEVQTPVFMPVGTQATVKGQTVETLKATGARVLLANTYHLLLRPGPEVFRKFGGIHRFMNWDGPVLTDSGGFQIFSLPGERAMNEEGARFKSYVDGTHYMLSPETSVAMQRAIGSDINMVLDQCIPSTAPYEQAEAAMHLTHRWAVRSLAAAEKTPLRKQLAAEAEAHAFYQYLFFAQWRALRAAAAARGIEIIGDIPIFVAADSADVWANPELFELDAKTGRPSAVAGVPPDYFSADGQLWGNPLYKWERHVADGFAWWHARLRASFELCDVVRIDHFRGFDAYWRIPATAPTARTGEWVQAPGMELFKSVRAAFPQAKIIAEDLGELTPRVVALREATGLPGMAILQFAFGGDDAENLYLPHNLVPNGVIYPGTHDNDTTIGWYATTTEKERDHARRYLRVDGREIGWDFIRASYAAVSRLAVFPMQDVLSLGSAARFNAPGKPQGNWQWRYRPAQLEQLIAGGTAAYLKSLGAMYGR